jgi:uncharacterized membrane protein
MTETLDKWAVPFLAALGLADAVYLAVLHLFGEPPPCGAYSGCADVNSSPYAEIFGVPIAALGALLYAGLLGVGLLRTRLAGEARSRATLLLYGAVLSGTLFMAYLTAVELLVLHAICYWCVALATITLILLILLVREVWQVGTG